jgi:hypothetical protein
LPRKVIVLIMRSARRGVLARGSFIAAVVVVAVQILALADYRDVSHVYLQKLNHPILGLALIGVLVLVSALFARRGALRVIGLVAAFGAFAAGLGLWWLVELFGGLVQHAVVAKSPGYDVVADRLPHYFEGTRYELRLRTRQGLGSLQGETSVACFATPGSPSRLGGRVEFVGEYTVRLYGADGSTSDVEFDPRTLKPLTPVIECLPADAAYVD